MVQYFLKYGVQTTFHHYYVREFAVNHKVCEEYINSDTTTI